ncbi:MAG TPA: hypothetical protein VGV15_01230, partial [Terriglobales bacterium]|nr:hypothetical protein [Terriglobales bacterium]
MLRASLLSLALACIPALAQNQAIQVRVAAHQSLIRELRDDLSRYKPSHPQVTQSRSLIGVLEEQT